MCLYVFREPYIYILCNYKGKSYLSDFFADQMTLPAAGRLMLRLMASRSSSVISVALSATRGANVPSSLLDKVQLAIPLAQSLMLLLTAPLSVQSGFSVQSCLELCSRVVKLQELSTVTKHEPAQRMVHSSWIPCYAYHLIVQAC